MHFPELPVPTCYARIVDNGLQDVQVGTAAEKLAVLDISVTDKSDDVAANGGSMILKNTVRKNVSVFSFSVFLDLCLNSNWIGFVF